MMNLNELVSPWVKTNFPAIEITGLSNDSRKLSQGEVFLAYPGAQVDGRIFIPQVIEKGASAVIYDPEDDFVPAPSPIPLIPIPHLFKTMALLAARFYGFPTQHMTLIGITGTNGKTTIAYQLAQAFNFLGCPAVYIGTLGWGKPFKLNALVNTTPDGLCLQQIFHQCLSQGIQVVCMEVSSHALAEDRVDGIHFTQAIFTNLTRDHLDYHQTMEAYGAAKAKLFAYPELKAALFNVDDEASLQMKAALSSSTICQINYGLNPHADLYASDIKMSSTGSQFKVVTADETVPCSLPAVGLFNIYNALALVASLKAAGFSLQAITDVLPVLKSAPGRLELVIQEPAVFVDYAHTPDALENVLATLQSLVKGKLIIVFGCGGDRDEGKRPLMGKIASQFADVIILTNDNPRSENPHEILDAIEKGMRGDKKPYRIPDRHEAIRKALEVASLEDIVLVAGKGHENYQEIGGKKIHFSDQEEILKATQFT